MPAGVRLKKSLNTMPNLSSGRAKETAGRVPSPDRRRKGGREIPRGRRSEHESGDSEPYRRERSPGRKSDSAVKAKHHRLVRERNVREAGMRGSFRERRRAADDARDVREEEKSLRVRAPSRKSPTVEEKHTRKDVSAARRGKYSDAGLSQRKPSYVKQRNFEEDDSDAETGSVGEARPLRGHRGRMDDHRGGKDSDRSKRRGVNVEMSADKFRFMGKKRDGFISRDKSKGDDQVNYRENHAKSKGERMGNDGNLRKRLEKKNDWHDSNESVRTVFEDLEELKRHQARLPEKPGKRMASRNKFSDVEPLATDAPPDKGKRIASRKKSSDVESAATDAPPKKRKRIKLDPYDTSNKRLDDTVPDEDHVEKTVEKEIKISMNAQFRSIQPNHSILSFVEDNLLGRRRLIELQNAGYNIKLSAPLDNIPFSTSTERGRMEENIFRNKLEFFAAAKISSSFPPPTIPEIAFAGRSNVGKSSLLNALTRQWGVVRTSDKPGYTQTINFFRLASKLCLVDLPGYGFAYAKEEVKDAWEELVKEYVSTRVGLQRVCLLIDTKWGMKPRDHELIDLMERSETPYQIILTKTDAVFPIDVARRAMQIEENLNKNKSIVNPVMMVSSTSGAGIRSLRTMLAKLARFIKP